MLNESDGADGDAPRAGGPSSSSGRPWPVCPGYYKGNRCRTVLCGAEVVVSPLGKSLLPELGGFLPLFLPGYLGNFL